MSRLFKLVMSTDYKYIRSDAIRSPKIRIETDRIGSRNWKNRKKIRKRFLCNKLHGVNAYKLQNKNWIFLNRHLDFSWTPLVQVFKQKYGNSVLATVLRGVTYMRQAFPHIVRINAINYSCNYRFLNVFLPEIWDVKTFTFTFTLPLASEKTNHWILICDWRLICENVI